MSIFLLTGAIGTGKTTYCVDELMKADEANKKHIKDGNLDKVRKIYSNIDGLKVDHDPLPDDWRTTPKNSIIAYDECHKIDIFKPTRKTLHDDERIIALNESRHSGHDIYFITQSPKFLHQHIRGLVNQHFHFHNPMGASVATVFMWRHGNTTTPDSEQAKSKAENSFIYSFDKKVQENFSSVDGDDVQHTRKLRIPRKVILWCLAPIVLIGIIVYLLTKPSTTGNLTGETFVNQTKKELGKAQEATGQIGQSTTQNNLDIECRKSVNVEKPECVEWFNNLSKNNGSVSGDNAQNTIVSYNPNTPFDQKEIQETVRYEVTAKPVFSGCMKKNGRYVAYTQQGTILNEVSQSDCQKLMNGDRPFNYFANNNQNQGMNTQQQYQQQTNPNPVQRSPQPVQMANNQVDPHLEAKVVSGANGS
ncbi:MAG: zonular occludens toxin [Acinetobacter sp.]|nr:zonular occludens toxin [Acinetobacter sp.]